MTVKDFLSTYQSLIKKKDWIGLFWEIYEHLDSEATPELIERLHKIAPNIKWEFYRSSTLEVMIDKAFQEWLNNSTFASKIVLTDWILWWIINPMGYSTPEVRQMVKERQKDYSNKCHIITFPGEVEGLQKY